MSCLVRGKRRGPLAVFTRGIVLCCPWVRRPQARLFDTVTTALSSATTLPREQLQVEVSLAPVQRMLQASSGTPVVVSFRTPPAVLHSQAVSHAIVAESFGSSATVQSVALSRRGGE